MDLHSIIVGLGDNKAIFEKKKIPKIFFFWGGFFFFFHGGGKKSVSFFDFNARYNRCAFSFCGSGRAAAFVFPVIEVGSSEWYIVGRLIRSIIRIA